MPPWKGGKYFPMCRTLSFVSFNGAPEFDGLTSENEASCLMALTCLFVIYLVISLADISMTTGVKVADSLLAELTPLVEVQLALRSSEGATIAAEELTSLVVALTTFGALPALLALTQSQRETVWGGMKMVRTVLAAQPAPDAVVTLKSGKTQNEKKELRGFWGL